GKREGVGHTGTGNPQGTGQDRGETRCPGSVRTRRGNETAGGGRDACGCPVHIPGRAASGDRGRRPDGPLLRLNLTKGAENTMEPTKIALKPKEEQELEDKLKDLLEFAQIHHLPCFFSVVTGNTEKGTKYRNLVYSAQTNRIQL